MTPDALQTPTDSVLVFSSGYVLSFRRKVADNPPHSLRRRNKGIYLNHSDLELPFTSLRVSKWGRKAKRGCLKNSGKAAGTAVVFMDFHDDDTFFDYDNDHAHDDHVARVETQGLSAPDWAPKFLCNSGAWTRTLTVTAAVCTA